MIKQDLESKTSDNESYQAMVNLALTFVYSLLSVEDQSISYVITSQCLAMFGCYRKPLLNTGSPSQPTV